MSILSVEVDQAWGSDLWRVSIPGLTPVVLQPGNRATPIFLTSRCCSRPFREVRGGTVPMIRCNGCDQIYSLPEAWAWPDLAMLEQVMLEQLEAYGNLNVLEPELAAYELRSLVERILRDRPLLSEPRVVEVEF